MKNKINIIKCESGGYVAFYKLTPLATVACQGKGYDELIKNFVDAYKAMDEYLKIEKTKKS